jgi:hypothetical protein
MRVPDARRWPAPSFEEQSDMLGVRVPAALRESLRKWVVVLRQRLGTGVSQKRLPEQEVVAFLLWMLGDADDPERVDHIEELFREFRKRRHEVSAQAAMRH